MREAGLASAFTLAEEAAALARSASPFAWAIYLSGIVPFFGLLLFEASDIMQNPLALDRLLLVSLGLALCYVWMHACQAMFSGALYAQATDSEFAPGRPAIFSSVANQAAIQPLKLIAWPCALILVVPHAVVTMFFQHALLAGSAPDVSVGDVAHIAAKQAKTRQSESYFFLAIVLLLRLILWANLLVLLFTLPALWHIFTGIDTAITRRPMLLLNPASWVAMLSLCYIALDPVVKAACVLRALAEESRKSGLDLRLRLARIRNVAALLLAAVAFGMAAQAADTQSHKMAISPTQMTAAIESVFHDPGLSWDLPVARKKAAPKNAIYSFFESSYDNVAAAWQGLAKWMAANGERLRRWLAGASGDQSGKSKLPEPRGVALTVEGLAVLIGFAMIVMLWRSRSKRAAETEVLTGAPIGAAIDEETELDASARPQHEWQSIAEDYATDGNLRMALRSWYLAGLAALSQAGLISVGKGKSNLDYLAEIQRRNKRGPAEVLILMRTNVRTFERVWYGEHEVNREIYIDFTQNVLEMRKCL
jgi:hypothetical protein